MALLLFFFEEAEEHHQPFLCDQKIVVVFHLVKPTQGYIVCVGLLMFVKHGEAIPQDVIDKIEDENND